MSATQHGAAEARRRGDRLLAGIGRELRDARVQRGLGQRTVASSAGVSQATVSLIERGKNPGARIETLARLAALVGLDLSMRVFPGGEPIRDAAHAKLLASFRVLIGDQWTWAAEVPLPIAGDKRAWDRLMSRAGIRIGVEAETRPTDLQELQRRLKLKKRDGGVDRLILVLPNTEWCRRVVRLNDLTETFPVPGAVALRALTAGRDPGGDAVILITT
jgi:transcriptional regulator with XRE-family HTH domain